MLERLCVTAKIARYASYSWSPTFLRPNHPTSNPSSATTDQPPEILRHSLRPHYEGPHLRLCLHLRLKETHHTRSRQWKRDHAPPRILPNVRERYLRSRRRRDQRLPVHHDRDSRSPWRSAAQGRVLVQAKGEMDAGGSGYFPQARDQGVVCVEKTSSVGNEALLLPRIASLMCFFLLEEAL